MTTKIEIAGFTIKSASQRRFIVIAYREAADEFFVVTAERGREVCRTKDGAEATRVAAKFEDSHISRHGAFARIEKRSDSVETARREARRVNTKTAIFDTATGEWV